MEVWPDVIDWLLQGIPQDRFSERAVFYKHVLIDLCHPLARWYQVVFDDPEGTCSKGSMPARLPSLRKFPVERKSLK
jgi:hypothetical protein